MSEKEFCLCANCAFYGINEEEGVCTRTGDFADPNDYCSWAAKIYWSSAENEARWAKKEESNG